MDRRKRWYLKNKGTEKMKEIRRRTYLKNKEKNRKPNADRRRERLKKDPEFSKKIRKYRRDRSRLQRFEAMELLGGKCVRCGFSDWRALQFDHIDGGGTRDKKGKDSWVILKRIKSGKFKYQLLCANCNWIKRYENDEVNRKYKLLEN